MSTLEPPPPGKDAPPPRQDWPRWTEDKAGDQQRKISVSIGLGITILFHLLAVGLFPWDEISVIEAEQPRQNPPLEVEFLPPPERSPEFVETNPIAPEEKPEDTDRIAAQDQVAAQEIPDPDSDSPDPLVEGEELESNKIVAGDITSEMGPASPEVLSQPAPPTPPSQSQQEAADPSETPPEQEQPVDPSPQPTEQTADTAEQANEAQYVDAETSEADPAMDEVKAIEVDEAPIEEEGFKAAVEVGEAEVKVEETQEESAQPERAENDRLEVVMEEVPVSESAEATQSNQPRPQARPRLNFKVTSGPLKIQPRSSNRAGAVAVDANFDKFGAYLQRMVEAVDLQWQLLARQSSTITSEMGSRVVIRYDINQKGEITSLEVLFSSASRSGTAMCLNAIQSRSPYGIWTEEMVKTLGEEETITFTFYYR